MSYIRAWLRTLREPRTLAWCAGLLGAAALLADVGGPGNAAAIARAAAAAEDAVDPIELARWIREDRPGLRVIDVRDSAAFEAYGVLTAVNLPIEALDRLRPRADEILVFYGDGDTPAAQAATVLRMRGQRQAYYLRGGLIAWVEQVMQPELRAEATPGEVAAFREIAELSRWFGGLPRTGVVGAPPIQTRASRATGARPVVPLRRGCAPRLP
jgi:rhodanese-related sulfurtransferase